MKMAKYPRRTDGKPPVLLAGPSHSEDGELYADVEECRLILTHKPQAHYRAGPLVPVHTHLWDRTKYREHDWCRCCGLTRERPVTVEV